MVISRLRSRGELSWYLFVLAIDKMAVATANDPFGAIFAISTAVNRKLNT